LGAIPGVPVGAAYPDRRAVVERAQPDRYPAGRAADEFSWRSPSPDMTIATDHAAFTELLQRHRRELHVHCYRMLGSFDDCEDLVQETFLLAWRGRATFAGRSSLRAWLYKIATNACLDAELAFLVAIQHLAPLPRAVIILRDVLGCSAEETSELLETTVASVNSALQRARAGMRAHLPERRLQWGPDSEPTAAERRLLDRVVEFTERADVRGLANVLHEHVRFTMPPQPGVWQGRDRVVQSWIDGGFGSDAFGSLRCLTAGRCGQGELLSPRLGPLARDERGVRRVLPERAAGAGNRRGREDGRRTEYRNRLCRLEGVMELLTSPTAPPSWIRES